SPCGSGTAGSASRLPTITGSSSLSAVLRRRAQRRGTPPGLELGSRSSNGSSESTGGPCRLSRRPVRAARSSSTARPRPEAVRSAWLLRCILRPVGLMPCKPEVGRGYYRAETALQILDLLEDPDAGSNSLRQRRRGESNHLG